MTLAVRAAPVRRRWRSAGLAPAALLVLALAAGSLCFGTRWVSPGEAWGAVVAFNPNDDLHLLVRHLRIPRALAAVLLGAALGAAGAAMQALTRNPLAEPGLLGVNAGAAAGITSAIAFLGIVDVAGYIWFGLAGAALAGAGVYLLGGVRQGLNPVRFVLAGAALTVVLLAYTQILVINSDEAVFDQFRHWAVGSLAGRGYAILAPVALLTAIGLLLLAALAGGLDAMSLGEDLSRALGAHPAVIWSLSALAVVMLAGAATAAAGPISFLGLAAPHIARRVAGGDHRWVLAWAAVLSAGIVLIADVLGRVVAPPGEVGVGIMIALIGGPFFVALVRGRSFDRA